MREKEAKAIEERKADLRKRIREAQRKKSALDVANGGFCTAVLFLPALFVTVITDGPTIILAGVLVFIGVMILTLRSCIGVFAGVCKDYQTVIEELSLEHQMETLTQLEWDFESILPRMTVEEWNQLGSAWEKKLEKWHSEALEVRSHMQAVEVRERIQRLRSKLRSAELIMIERTSAGGVPGRDDS